MATALGLVLICGLLGNLAAQRLRLPGLLGMLVAGLCIGPFGIGLISSEMVTNLADFRKIALVIILYRAGLGLKKDQLAAVGKSALLMSFLPGVLEASMIAVASTVLFHFTLPEGFVLGFIIAAVSPAVVVPRMLSLVEQGRGRGIPTLILAGASADDVVAITLFTASLAIVMGGEPSLLGSIGMIPVSIIAGIVAGVLMGVLLTKLFTRRSIRDTKKVLILLGTAFLMLAVQDLLHDRFEIAMLLGIMTIGFLLLEKIPEKANRIATKMNKLWIPAEIILFVLVGAQVDPSVALKAGAMGGGIIVLGLFARSIGVFLSLIRSDFSAKERLFAAIAYTPKATVQAAIGAIPLEAGLASGDTILAVAVLSIMITAPLGAQAINYSSSRLLTGTDNSRS